MAEARTYRIGEVAEMLNLKTHVLRFWETEFPQIDPMRAESGQRIYTEEHVNILRRIQRLLHEQGMTIEGAKRILSGVAVPETVEEPEPLSDPEFLETLRKELAAICNLLRQGAQP